MRVRSVVSGLLILSMIVLSSVVGCGKSSKSISKDQSNKTGTSKKHPHPHDSPMTDAEKKQLREDVASWEKAVSHIKQFRDEIKKETTEGEPEHAHRPLDKLDLVLEWLPEIAKSSKVAKADWQTVGSRAQSLRELFNKVHMKIDDGEAPDYASVAAEIDKAVSALEGIKVP